MEPDTPPCAHQNQPVFRQSRVPRASSRAPARASGLTFPSSFAFPISRRESPPDYVESPARDIYLAPPDRRDRAACVATIAVLDARATSLARPFRVQPSRTNLRARAVARVSVEIASSARTVIPSTRARSDAAVPRAPSPSRALARAVDRSVDRDRDRDRDARMPPSRAVAVCARGRRRRARRPTRWTRKQCERRIRPRQAPFIALTYAEYVTYA